MTEKKWFPMLMALIIWAILIGCSAVIAAHPFSRGAGVLNVGALVMVLGIVAMDIATMRAS